MNITTACTEFTIALTDLSLRTKLKAISASRNYYKFLLDRASNASALLTHCYNSYSNHNYASSMKAADLLLSLAPLIYIIGCFTERVPIFVLFNLWILYGIGTDRRPSFQIRIFIQRLRDNFSQMIINNRHFYAIHFFPNRIFYICLFMFLSIFSLISPLPFVPAAFTSLFFFVISMLAYLTNPDYILGFENKYDEGFDEEIFEDAVAQGLVELHTNIHVDNFPMFFGDNNIVSTLDWHHPVNTDHVDDVPEFEDYNLVEHDEYHFSDFTDEDEVLNIMREYPAHFDHEELVGVEHNPGPEVWIAFLLIFTGPLNTLVYFFYQLWIIAKVNRAELTSFIMLDIWFLYHSLMAILSFCFMGFVLYCLTDFPLAPIQPRFVYLFPEANIPPDPPLVGIEPNPGPNDIVQFLKNMEKLEDFASTRKRSSKKVSKASLSHQRKQIKSRENSIRVAREFKNCRIFPQGLFTVETGFDNATLEHLDSMMNKLMVSLGNININHTLDIPLADKISRVIGYIKQMGYKIWNICLGFIKIVLQFLCPHIASLISLFISGEDNDEVWYDAREAQPQNSLPFKIIAAMIHSKHFKDTVSFSDWDIFSESLLNLKKSVDASSSVMTILHNVMREIGTFVHDVFDIKIPFIYVEDPMLQAIYDEAALLWHRYTEGTIDDHGMAERIFVFIAELEHKIYDKSKTLSKDQKEKLTYILRKFQPVIQYCTKYSNPDNGPRCEPLAICICGPTGVGKSTFTVPFILALISRVISKDKLDAFLKNHNDFMFFRHSENEFWDGLRKLMFAVIYDDFGQKKDSKGVTNEDAFEFIRGKNTSPYHLHYSSIEDKQKHYFSSKIMFATTNLHQFNFESLTCSEAVARRMDLAYLQVPRAEFCQDDPYDTLGPWCRRIDMAKVRAVYPEIEGDIETFVALNVAEFIPWDFYKATRGDGPSLSFWELLDVAEKKFYEVTTKGEKMMKFHDFIKHNPRPNIVPQSGFSSPSVTFDSIKSAIKSVVEPLKELGKGCYKYSRGELSQHEKQKLTLVLGGLGMVYGIYKWLLPSNHDDVDLQGTYQKASIKSRSVSIKSKSRSRQYRKVNRSVNKGELSAQSGDTRLNSYLKLLKRNMYKFSHPGIKDTDYGWAIFLFDRTFLIPRHFMYAVDSHVSNVSDNEQVLVSFKNPFSKRDNIIVDWIDDVEMYDYWAEHEIPPDYVFMRIRDEKCRIHADISEMFADSSLIRDGESVKCQLAVERNENILFLLPDVRCNFNDQVVYSSQVTDAETHKPLSVKGNGIYYAAPTEVGDCGSVLLTLDPRFKKPTIMGIHTAGFVKSNGKTRQAIGNFICKEDITKLKCDIDSITLVEDFDVEDVEIQGFNALYTAPQPRMPRHSKLRKSLFYNNLWTESKDSPSILHPFVNSDGEFIDPASIAREGYSHDEVYIDERIFSISSNQVANLVLTKDKPAPWKPRLFSYEEAIAGIDGVPYADGICRSTSPGYPYCLDVKNQKKSWFGSEGPYTFDSPNAIKLKEHIMSILSDLKCGKRMNCIYVDYLKDQRRPKDKVQKGKNRIFGAASMDFLILCKMYFGDFIRSICDNRIINGSATGINVYDEWDTLVKYLTGTHKDSRKFTAGDYAKYDGKIPVRVGYEVLDIVEKFYYNSTIEDTTVRQILWLEIINSFHIADGKVYEFVGGNPSGQPLTTIFNSVANLLMISYVGACNWVDSGGELRLYSKIFSVCRFSVFGDDNLIAYPEEYDFIFGQQKLEKTMPLYVGMEYTNESKSEEALNARDITQVSFLKRGFRYDHGKWMCPLEMRTIEETLYWEKSTSYESEMKERIEATLFEIAQHGEYIFNRMAPVLLRACQELYSYTPTNSRYHVALDSATGLAWA